MVRIRDYFNRTCLIFWLAYWLGTSLGKVGQTYTGTYYWYDPWFILWVFFFTAWLGAAASKESRLVWLRNEIARLESEAVNE